VTAISKEEEQVFRGYSAGAVDYVFKPFNPTCSARRSRSSSSCYEKSEQLRRQAEQLKEQELAELRARARSATRVLAEAQPDQIWTALPNGELDYVNQRALDYFESSFRSSSRAAWTKVCHPRTSAHARALAEGARDRPTLRERAPAPAREGRRRTAGT
jgi:response regulator RpfG family c-di-GMP phosphodiesterase